MKAIILAAGYGTRLQKDIENDLKQEYKHLLGVPKPLVPVGGECLISRWMTNILAVQTDCEISKVYVVVSYMLSYIDKIVTYMFRERFRFVFVLRIIVSTSKRTI